MLLICVVIVSANNKDKHQVKSRSSNHNLHSAARIALQKSAHNHQQRSKSNGKLARHKDERKLQQSENRSKKSQQNRNKFRHDLDQRQTQARIFHADNDDGPTHANPIHQYLCIVKAAMNISEAVREDYGSKTPQNQLSLDIDDENFFQIDVVPGEALNCTFVNEEYEESTSQNMICQLQIPMKIMEKFKPELGEDGSKKHKLVLQRDDDVVLDIYLDLDSPTCMQSEAEDNNR
ncbi:hypothetical protein QE152_g39043 [Popillia japonica]|uniref:Uncharacterized protein n=1 Tax=Popillia japonica TaxID=7064 RepID=A0AAW1HV69_POPJA